jgi:hypothetical protein
VVSRLIGTTVEAAGFMRVGGDNRAWPGCSYRLDRLLDLSRCRDHTIDPGIPLHGTVAIVAYAYDQIDQARAELEAVSK